MQGKTCSILHLFPIKLKCIAVLTNKAQPSFSKNKNKNKAQPSFFFSNITSVLKNLNPKESEWINPNSPFYVTSIVTVSLGLRSNLRTEKYNVFLSTKKDGAADS